MTTPRDDIAGLSERLRRHYTMSMFVTKDSLIASLTGEREEAATQLDALSARVKELEANPTPQDYMKMARMWADEKARAIRAEQERDEAYERAAQVCQDLRHCDYSSETPDWSNGTLDCAAAIRRLASGPEKDSPPAGTEG